MLSLEKSNTNQDAKELYPELLTNVVDYFDPQLQNPTSSAQINELSLIFMIDLSLKPKDVEVGKYFDLC